jgi:hypothetical protein
LLFHYLFILLLFYYRYGYGYNYKDSDNARTNNNPSKNFKLNTTGVSHVPKGFSSIS